MSRKHAELEREFIEDLVPRTGKSLADWMAAIDEARLDDKNAIIDWLRPQGLTFAHASWLERIHNNGGRPIYLDIAGSPPAPVAAPIASKPSAPPAGAPQPAPPPPPEQAATGPRLRPPVSGLPNGTGPVPSKSPQPAFAKTVSPPAPETLAVLLARGKGQRPLAEFVLREIRAALPNAVFHPVGDLVSIGCPAEIGVMLIGPREHRLGLALGNAPFEGKASRCRIPGAGPKITHMIVLSDARQVDEQLIELVLQASQGGADG